MHDVRDDVTAAMHRALEIQEHGAIPDRHVDVGDPRVFRHGAAGAVEQNVDATEMRDGVAHATDWWAIVFSPSFP